VLMRSKQRIECDLRPRVQGELHDRSEKRLSGTSRKASKSQQKFTPDAFLASICEGGKAVLFAKKAAIFQQGAPADAVFCLQTGKVKLTVVSKTGKEATIGMLIEECFFGEGALAGQAVRMCSATALTDCAVVRVEKDVMMRALHREQEFSDLFVAYLLARNIRYEEDLVDQLFNSSEKRLARMLLLLARFGKEGYRSPWFRRSVRKRWLRWRAPLDRG
jgi:CRP/FNR family cyclic AMP-dependent transcriptional regulator